MDKHINIKNIAENLEKYFSEKKTPKYSYAAYVIDDIHFLYTHELNKVTQMDVDKSWDADDFFNRYKDIVKEVKKLMKEKI